MLALTRRHVRASAERGDDHSSQNLILGRGPYCHAGRTSQIIGDATVDRGGRRGSNVCAHSQSATPVDFLGIVATFIERQFMSFCHFYGHLAGHTGSPGRMFDTPGI